MRLWKTAEAVYDTTTDSSGPGWIVKATEVEADGAHSFAVYTPPPTHYYLGRDADPAEIIVATAKWEQAVTVPETPGYWGNDECTYYVNKYGRIFVVQAPWLDGDPSEVRGVPFDCERLDDELCADLEVPGWVLKAGAPEED